MKSTCRILSAIALICLATTATVHAESLADRYATLESKFLLILESVSGRNSGESEQARSVLRESRQRDIVNQLRTLEQLLHEKRLTEAITRFKKVESDLNAVEMLLDGKSGVDGEIESGKEIPEQLDRTKIAKSGKNATRQDSPALRERIVLRLLFRLKELKRRQTDIHEQIPELKNRPPAELVERLARQETEIAEKVLMLRVNEHASTLGPVLTQMIAGIASDAKELADLLKRGDPHGESLPLSSILLDSMAEAIRFLETLVREEPPVGKKDTITETDETGTQPDYMPARDELIMIRQMQERIVVRIEMCEQARSRQPNRLRELEQMIFRLAREQEQLIQMLRPPK